MKRFLFLMSVSGALMWSQGLSSVHSVYLLPMSRGLDQYLANRLTSEHVLQVVTDPKKADAILTDRIGESFEQQVSELLASPKAAHSGAGKVEKEPPAEGSAPGHKSDESKTADSSSNPAPAHAGSLLDPTVNQLPDLSRNSGFGRTRGMVFLVDPKSREVLWSTYRPPKDSSAGRLDRAASDIVSRLKRDQKTKQ